MAYTEKRLVAGSALTTSSVTYYTVTSPVLKTIVKEMVLCNATAAPVTFTLYIVPSGGSPATANTEFKEVTLQAYETRIFGRTCVMEQGSTIRALASAAGSISLDVSGVERT